MPPMTRPPRRRTGAALIGCLLLAACGGGLDPSPSAPSASATIGETSLVPTTAEPSPGQTVEGTTYTVQGGDSLSSIARAWGTTVVQLQAWNAVRYPSLTDDPDSLQAGWVLIVAAASGATPLPTASPPPAALCHAGNRPSAGSAQTFYVVPGAGNGVALTFDMGGRLDPGVDILNFLIANEVCATIFPTGAMAQSAQGRAIMAIIRAHPELFEIGNHTMHHCDLARGGLGSPTTAPCQTGGAPSADFIRDELTDAEAILRELTGQDPRPYWRPPYGSVNDAVISAAASVGYTKTFMWDIDTIDWKPISQGGPTAQQIATKVVTTAEGGSNVLMHLGGYETLGALQFMVPGLRERGFVLTSLSDLLD
jgi:peptidoglycan/xylan/chitin deacetylase (PgdA/CDA1 family)/LysM repeat protein